MNSKIVVNPMANLVKTPDVNLGDCSKQGKWDKPSQVNDCKICIQKSSSDYPYFYCDGNCTSEYDLGGATCSTTSLVAKTASQCENPCYQSAAPNISGGCNDDYDCKNGQACIKKNVKGSDGMMHKDRGVCQDKKTVEKYTTNSQSSYSKATTEIIIISVIVLICIILFLYSIFKKN